MVTLDLRTGRSRADGFRRNQTSYRRTFKVYNERRNLLIALIKKELKEYVTFDTPDGGLAIWLRLKEGYEKVAEQALKHKVRILSGTLFSESQQQSVHAIRLGFGSLTTTELEKGVLALKAAFSSA